MHTEFNSGQFCVKNDDYKQEDKPNSFLTILWKILLVIIILVLGFLLMLKLEVITLKSSIIPEAILLNQNEIGLKKGKSYQLVSTVVPDNAENKNVVWSSSDPNIVEVNEVSGYITAKKTGSATITVKSIVNDISTNCLVSVVEKNIIPNSLQINEKYISVAAGYTNSLTYRTSPSNSTENDVKFTSTDPSVAVVTEKGVINGIKEGNAIITVTGNNGAVKDTTYVTVYKKGTSTVVEGESVNTTNYPKSLKLNYEKLDLKIGTTAIVIPTITPISANQKLTWSSSNSRIATVDSNGLIKAVGLGNATIIAETINGITANIKVTVGEYSLKLRSIDITTNYSVIPVGVSKQLFVSFYPENASNKSITWVSSNSSVATVSQTGLIKTVSPGTAIITAASNDGGYKDTVSIDVIGENNIQEIKSIGFAQAIYQIGIGGTINLNPIITPNNATFKSLTYQSDNSNVATVDVNGVVTGLSEGEVTITTIAKHNQLKANTKIIVKNIPAKSLTLNATTVNLKVGETFTLLATVLPANASNKTVEFVSSNSNIVSVDNNGIITAKNVGTATITITPNGGGSPSTCLVTIK